MKIASHIAAGLLGLLFIVFSLLYFTGYMPKQPELPPGSPAAMFMGAFGPTGYMQFVKVIELVGGLLLIIPFTRNAGLLLLGPVIINIFAYHIFLTDRAQLFSPPMLLILVLGSFLLWMARDSFIKLLRSS
jgi:putative oxidoreductase